MDDLTQISSSIRNIGTFDPNPAPIMYSVKPLMTDSFSVNPAPIMYHVNGYHEHAFNPSEAMGDVASNNELPALATAEAIEKKQLELIEQLTAFIDRINKFFSTKNVNGQDAVKKTNVTKCKVEKSVPMSECSGEPFYFNEEVPNGTKVDQSLRACTAPLLPKFEVPSVPGSIALCLSDEDRQWINVLAKLGTHRGVAYTGELVNDVVKGTFTVFVNYTAADPINIEAKVNGESLIYGRIAVMKFIGSITGLLPPFRSTALPLTGVDFWLLTADRLISNQLSVDYICRLLSNNLSSCDFLGTQYVPNISDVIMFSLVKKQTNITNNVELWLKRMQKLLE